MLILRQLVTTFVLLLGLPLRGDQQEIRRVDPAELRGLSDFCVFVTKEKQVIPKAAEVFVESLREKAPAGLAFVTESAACRSADATFAYDVGKFYGLVYRIEGNTQKIFIDHTLGVKPDEFIDEFLAEWVKANEPRASVQ